MLVLCTNKSSLEPDTEIIWQEQSLTQTPVKGTYLYMYI